MFLKGLGNVVPQARVTIRDGDQGTQDTLEAMGALAVQAAHDPQFVDHARAIVAHLPSKDYLGQARAIFKHVKKTVRYVYDPLALEVLTDPRWLLFVVGSGDCDEHAALIAALGMAVGLGGAFRTVGLKDDQTDPTKPPPWSHVYALLGVPKGQDVEWLAADTTQKESYLGWEPEARVERKGTWMIAPPA